MESWHNPEVIFANCLIVAARRGQVSKKDFKGKIAYYRERYQARISLIEMENIHISSRGIRKHIEKGEPYSYYCPDKVSKYIAYHRLYGFTKPPKKELTMFDIHSMLKCICRPKRFLHILGVQYISTALAMRYGVDIGKAEMAGVLHDCGKYLSYEEQLAACELHGVSLTQVEKDNPALIHAKLGVEIAKDKYFIRDPEILDAIRYHTTGHKNMTMLEKIVYLADYIEPSRAMNPELNSLEKIRSMAFNDIDKAVFMTLENCIDYLEKQGNSIDQMTYETYEYYKNAIK